MQVLHEIGWPLLSIIESRKPGCHYLLNIISYFIFDPLWIISTACDTWILHFCWLKYIYLYASAVHLNIVWFDYIVANYVTVIPHRAHQ